MVEISDSTLGFDLTTKAELYARAGIVEYWVIDVAARRRIVHQDLHEGLYRSIIAYSEQESIAPLAAPASQPVPDFWRVLGFWQTNHNTGERLVLSL